MQINSVYGMQQPIRADQVKIGDLIDLESDKYADPNEDHIAFCCELQLVVEVHHETPDCVAIGFEGFDLVGFPVNHMLTLVSEA
jgi:hypothetical protein